MFGKCPSCMRSDSMSFAKHPQTRIVYVLLVLFMTVAERSVAGGAEVDRLSAFLKRLASDDVEYCSDRTRLQPDCKECIPGLRAGAGSSSCNEFVPASLKIRNEIGKLTVERYGSKLDPSRPFGLYPYLEKPEFMQRQKMFGKMLGDYKAKHIVDIGAYYNPVNLFLSPSHCPISVVIIEPILDPLSAIVPCGGDGESGNTLGGAESGRNTKTHVVFLPITFRYYASFVAPHNPAAGTAALPQATQVTAPLPHPDYVVCIGCDAHYGPSRRMLDGTFARPFTLLIEYPVDYYHNRREFRNLGEGGIKAGEKVLFTQNFQYSTNDTQFTRRMMKTIEYTNVI